MMLCERCGKKTYIIFITKNYERICGDCEEEERIKVNGKNVKK